MSRRARLLAEAIAIAAAVAVAVVLLWTRPRPVPSGAPAAEPAGEGGAPVAAAAASAAGATPPAGAPGATPSVDVSPASATTDATADATPPPVPEWSEVRLGVRVSDLGPALARDVYDGLQRARAAMAGCFADAAREEALRPAGVRPQGDEMGPPIVTLHLESGAGELVIVSAPLQELGGGTTRLVGCCEAILVGWRIPARNAVPGHRYRLQHELM